MATYNGANYLAPLLDSLFQQTLLPTEVVVVDDCSKDSTIAILEKYAKKYPIKGYKNNTNLGVNKNFEKAVSLCSGDYILLCDQDDVWFPNNIKTKINSLEKMLVLAEKLTSDFKHCRADFYDINGQVYFGELTFSHFSGLEPFDPKEWDQKIGEWINIVSL